MIKRRDGVWGGSRFDSQCGQQRTKTHLPIQGKKRRDNTHTTRLLNPVYLLIVFFWIDKISNNKLIKKNFKKLIKK